MNKIEIGHPKNELVNILDSPLIEIAAVKTTFMIEPKFFLICQLSIYYTTYLDNLSLMFISYWESSIHMIPDKPLLSDLHTLECHFLTFILRLRLRV